MTDPDPAATYERLKTETAGMFGYDLADLSLTQGLQIDLVSLLRLEVDSMQGKVLAGETVDLARLVAAHGLLAKMLPTSALVAPAAAADHHDQFAGAREELARFLADRAERIKAREVRESERLLEVNAKLREENERLTAQLKAQEQPQPTQPANVVSIKDLEFQRLASRTPVPQSAAERAAAERAWRNSYGTGGAICAPAFNVDPTK
jgi:hypothetical protein